MMRLVTKSVSADFQCECGRGSGVISDFVCIPGQERHGVPLKRLESAQLLGLAGFGAPPPARLGRRFYGASQRGSSGTSP